MDTAIDLNMSFDFGMDQFNTMVLRNLINLLYSKSDLINRATGSSFHVQKTLVQMLSLGLSEDSIPAFIQTLYAHDAVYGPGLSGLEFTTETVRITGFASAPDVESLKAYGQLAVLMVRMACSSHWIQARQCEPVNDRYAFRVWLCSLGMNGPTFKRSRTILLSRLQGDMAFRNPMDARRSRSKHISAAMEEVTSA